MDIEQILGELTVGEKAALVAGTDFMYTRSLPRLKIPALRMSDGPHGLRVQEDGGDNGVTGSLPATAFPTAATVACGWNDQNSYQIGRAIGKEAHQYGVHVVLGPGANIKRNPLAGRNFEYYSEDPLLAGKLAAAEVEGIQGEGVGVSAKHFALNNAETFRFMGESIADMRAIREIYCKVFEIIVKESRPATLMCAYNRINGTYCAQNKWLLEDMLRKEWGFQGLVMTDWGAMHDRIASLRAGLDLEMPGDTAFCRRQIEEGIADGTLSMTELDQAVRNVLDLVAKYSGGVVNDCDFTENDRTACAVAQDCAVLLKNDTMLPLNKLEKHFVCGDLFEKMRYQGAGSSMITPIKLTSPKAAFDEERIDYVFARGYAENATKTEQKYIDEALALCKEFKKAIVFAGLTDYVESEGGDREDMRLPENQLALIDALVGAGKEVIVVLFGGSPVELPFADGVKAILNMYLPGQSGGRACLNLLFGVATPCGRLAETWPLKYDDVPFGNSFAKSPVEVYRESVFVGYRYYATANKRVRYPFGYGLSYTQFEYSDFSVKIADDRIVASCTVKNVGKYRGAEVVQVYAGMKHSAVFRPLRELKAFKKLYLGAGEAASATLEIPLAELRFWNAKQAKWQIEGGKYRIEFCTDCNSPIFGEDVLIAGETAENIYSDAVSQVYQDARFDGLTDALFEELSGIKIPPAPAAKPITLESRFSTLKEAGLMGKIVYAAVLGVAKRQMKEAKKLPDGIERDNKIKGALFLKRILESNSLISMSMTARGAFPYNFAEGVMHLSNGKMIRGIKCFCTKIETAALPKEKEDSGDDNGENVERQNI